MKTRWKYVPLTPERKKQVIHIFLNYRNNTVPEIMRVTGLSKHSINKVLNGYLKKEGNNV